MNILEFKQLVEDYGEVVAKLRIDELELKQRTTIQMSLEIQKYPEVLRFINRNVENEYIFVRMLVMNPDYWEYTSDVNLSVNSWRTLLGNRPEFYDRCPCVDQFTKEQWLGIIMNKSTLMKHFPFWDTLDNEDLFKLVPFHQNLAHLIDFDQLTDTQTFHLFLQNPPYLKALRMDKVDYSCVNFDRQMQWIAKEPAHLHLNPSEIRLLKHAATLPDWEDRKALHPRYQMLDQLGK